ncbi:MAG: MBOAT family O-acyltransferase [Planctomycetota bacterium]|jgi:alginate O-acetyltransferase complex protein AlgI
MVFSSISFLFFFLPLVLVGYHLIFAGVARSSRPLFWRRVSNFYLLLVSLSFYFWGEGWLVWIIIASSLIDYVCGLIIADGFNRRELVQLEEGGQRSARQRFAVTLSVVSNLCFLAYFKYFNFGVDAFNWIAPEAWQLRDMVEVALPLGISFYTFQSMSYTIDVYRGKVKATRHVIDFTSFVTIFPQLVAGPIVRYSQIAEQLVTRTVDMRLFASGVERFTIGLAKKVLIANTVAKAVDTIYALPESQLTMGVAWLGLLAFTVQVYFDFSGYSDMAIGLGRMLGFKFPENFNYPYISRSISEFWHRWHISLSTWFRDYLFIPLGGSRCSKGRMYFNLWTVFLLCGFWHGATELMVTWGALHGVIMVTERTRFGRWIESLPRPLSHAYMLLALMAGWPIFKAVNFEHSWYYYKALVIPREPEGYLSVQEYFSVDIRIAMVAGAIFSMPVYSYIRDFAKRIAMRGAVFAAVVETVKIAGLMALLVHCAMSLGAGTHNPFIYFRF